MHALLDVACIIVFIISFVMFVLIFARRLTYVDAMYPPIHTAES